MRSLAIALGLILVSGSVFPSPQDMTVTEEDFKDAQVYSPYAGRDYPDNVFFGDTYSGLLLMVVPARLQPANTFSYQ